MYSMLVHRNAKENRALCICNKYTLQSLQFVFFAKSKIIRCHDSREIYIAIKFPDGEPADIYVNYSDEK